MNDAHKFCIYCGKELPVDEDKIRLISENPDASCLNCGRPVRKGQMKCECGYEFKDIKCPQCLVKNEYTNKFCVSCGEKLWRLDVFDYQYDEGHFGVHLFRKEVPYKLRNISVFKRNRSDSLKPAPHDDSYESRRSEEGLQSIKVKVDRYLGEIRSRWKIVSPNYCINCLGTIRPQDYRCSKCGFDFTGDKMRVAQLQSANNYVEPKFDMEELKFAYKFYNPYLGSLAPSIGESQLEYRERLKWEFAENNIYKDNIRSAMARAPAYRPVETVRMHEQKTGNGGYCDYSCKHYCEELLDSSGGIVGIYTDGGIVDHYCDLGHSVSYGSYCEHYDKY
jgi:hypothetical protein